MSILNVKLGWALVDKKTGDFSVTTVFHSRENARKEQHKPTEAVKRVKLVVMED